MEMFILSVLLFVFPYTVTRWATATEEPGFFRAASCAVITALTAFFAWGFGLFIVMV